MGPSDRGIAAPTGSRKMSYLQNIEKRQRKSLVRDALFAAFVALATIVSITTVTMAIVASSATLHR
jgi:hypothetical protein